MPPVEILHDFFFIERGYLNGNHFALRSEKPILIDTGYVSDFDETQRLIVSLGISLTHIHSIINTHCHCDHAGGNRIIQDMSGCGIYLHRIGKHFIDTGDDWSTWWRYYDQAAEFFTCTKGVDDGDMLAVGPHEFEVIHTPGHASDQIVLYNRKEKILLSSDALWENDVAVMTVRVEGSRAVFCALESLERLAALDVKTIYPGHGRPFDDFKGAISKTERILLGYLSHPEKIGNDLLKKIIIYTLMMKRTFPEDAFLSHLRGTHWFKETVDLYFNGEYEVKYTEIMESFFRRGLVKRENDNIHTIAKR